MRRWLGLVFLMSSLAGCAEPGHGLRAPNAVQPPECGPGDEAIALPVFRYGNGLATAAMMDGKKVLMLVDTGAASSTISEKTAAQLDPNYTRESHATAEVSGFGGDKEARKTSVAQMRLGKLNVGSLNLLIVPDQQFDGVLGLDVMAHFDVDFDLLHQHVTLHSKGLCAGERPNWPNAVQEFPAVRPIVSRGLTAPFMLIGSQVDDEPMLAILDSGALVGSVIHRRFASKLGVDANIRDTLPTDDVSGAGGVEKSPLYQFHQLIVGDEIFPNPKLHISTTRELRFPLVLGADYFRHHRIWFSFASNRIFVSRVP